MKTKNTKYALMKSFLALLLCFTMLIGATFAWFTDTAYSGINRIVAGNLDVDLLMWKNATDGYQSIAKESPEEEGDIFKAFSIAQNSSETLWEPGKTQVVYLGIQNKGNLALKYNVVLNVIDDYNGDGIGLVGESKTSLEYLIIDGATYENASELIAAAGDWETLKAADGAVTGDIFAGQITAAENGVLDEIVNGTENETDYFVLAVHMKEDAGNEYKKGDAAIDVRVVATQKDAEFDSFANTYDLNAVNFDATSAPVKTVSLTIPVDPSNEVAKIVRAPEDGESLTLDVQNQDMTVTYAVGTKLTDDTVIADDKKTADAKLGFEYVDSDSEIGITISGGQTLAHYEMTLNIADDNTKLCKVTKGLPKNLVNVVVYHNSTTAMAKLDSATATPAADTESYYYDYETGLLVLYVFHASPVEVTYDEANIKIVDASGKTTFSTLAALRDEVNAGNDFAGCTVYQIKNIELNKLDASGAFDESNLENWISIGKSNTGGYVADLPFSGTYDGQGYTISNLYHNCYFGSDGSDPGPFGLFGCVKDATIKNLTLDHIYLGSEEGLVNSGMGLGSFVGIAFGDSTFENLTLKNSELCGYIANCGGIVGGCTQGDFTFKNINVDDSNVLTTYNWGMQSACDTQIGGIIGAVDLQYGVAAKLGTSHVTLENCTVGAKVLQMNDVCSNYQWYQYRSSGMLIGGFTQNNKDGLWNNCDDITAELLAEAVDCENVKVVYDMWNHQWYKQDGDDFERIDDPAAVAALDPTDPTNVCLVFDQLFGGWSGGTWRYEAGTTFATYEGVTVTYLNDCQPKVE